MESETLLVAMSVGALVGFMAGRTWAEYARARHDGRKAMRSRRDYRK